MNGRTQNENFENLRGIKRISAAEEVFVTLHGWIMSQRLKHGDVLPSQNEMAKQFGVSRNTLREAIYKLTVMGLLTPKQGVGTVVNISSPTSYMTALSDHLLLNPATVREFLEARVFVERNIARLAAVRATPENIAAMETLIERQGLAIQKGDVETFIQLDSNFHVALASASGNNVLFKFQQTVQEMMHKFIAEVSCLPGAVDSAFGFHQKILDCIRRRDKECARDKINEHLKDVALRIERCVKVDLGIQTIFDEDSIEDQTSNNPSICDKGSKK